MPEYLFTAHRPNHTDTLKLNISEEEAMCLKDVLERSGFGTRVMREDGISLTPVIKKKKVWVVAGTEIEEREFPLASFEGDGGTQRDTGAYINIGDHCARLWYGRDWFLNKADAVACLVDRTRSSLDGLRAAEKALRLARDEIWEKLKLNGAHRQRLFDQIKEGEASLRRLLGEE